ncbi:MAG: DUF5655 domain-containing protein [Bullifex sp.]
MLFDSDPLCFDLYKALEDRVTCEIGNITAVWKKTQVSFFRKHMFMCASLLRVRKKSEMPYPYVTVTIGLRRKLDSCRVSAVTEPYPGRFTHHIIVADISDIDGELMGWISEAAEAVT